MLYAGRLSPEKGIYTFLSMLHTDLIDDDPCATQADDIGVITSMLLGWGHPEASPEQASAASDLRSLDGPEIDEGFGGSSRRLAEDTSRAHWVQLAALSARLD